ncbi:MAG: ribosome-associated translation inhibitor RaiA [Tissierellia bacterium]|nr:ribosome-associated translation inhibitor RaiA [Bacillota bacterium]NLL23022.1 ribosome-associated translation inhibitor RaiA [Tissierellia bacterium]
MKIEILGKNVNVSDAVRDRIEGKLRKLSKHFHNEVEAVVNLSQVKNSHIVEITIPLKNGAFIRVEESNFDMIASIDKALEKLSRQIRRHKTALRKRYQSNESIRFEELNLLEEEADEAEEEIRIVRTKAFPIKPMDPEEAIMQMNLLGHNFYVFLNAQTEEVNVVYSRKNGGYGLIEPVID